MEELKDKKAVIKEVLEWVYCIIIAIVLALFIRYFVGTPTIVQQKSMEPTLIQDERLILNRLCRTFKQTPERGDIITFEAPSNSIAKSEKAEYNRQFSNIFESFAYYVLEIDKVSYIKRVIGLPGDHIEIAGGKIYINEKELDEPYIAENVKTEAKNARLTDFIVPEGYIFAIGDNREYSADCRVFGCVPIDKVESKVWIRFWPLNLFGEVK